jgi:hypothetical protein
MASSDTPTPSSKADPTDTDETDVEQQEEEGQQTRPAVRPVPTPADLFPRGVRKPQAPVPGGGSQLATGTG